METQIKRKITPNKMIDVFTEGKVNIRHYYPEREKDVLNFDVAISYIIKIRHNEDENPRTLFNNALKKKK